MIAANIIIPVIVKIKCGYINTYCLPENKKQEKAPQHIGHAFFLTVKERSISAKR